MPKHVGVETFFAVSTFVVRFAANVCLYGTMATAMISACTFHCLETTTHKIYQSKDYPRRGHEGQ
jgi:hypothetical protein